ncbi:MAG: histidine kinase [Micrococcaceae bacterium]
MVKNKFSDIVSSKYFKVAFVAFFALLAALLVPNATLLGQNVYYLIAGIVLYFVITHNNIKFSAFAYFYVAVIPYIIATFAFGTVSVNRISINFFHIFLQISIIAAVITLYRKQKKELTKVKHQKAVQDAIYGERRRIARELHDVIAHSLTVIVTLTNGMSKIWDTKPEIAKQLTNEIADVSRSSLEDIRMVIGALRPEDNESNTKQQELYWEDSSIDELVQTFSKTGLIIDNHINYKITQQNLKITVYRIIQEALTNALRYADIEKPVVVSLTRNETELQVKICSQLKDSINSEIVGTKTGLTSLKERTELFKGTFKAGKENNNWVVYAVFPNESLEN